MELVSREAVNELLHRQREMQSYVNQLPTYDGVVWHPYPKEKPTDKFVDYLVTIYFPSAMFPNMGIRVAEWSVPFDNEGGEWYFREYIGDGIVTAWAELPMQYKEGAEE